MCLSQLFSFVKLECFSSFHVSGIADVIIGFCLDGCLCCGSAASTSIPRPGSDGGPCPPAAQHPHVCGPAAETPAAPALRGLPQVH